MSEFEQWLQTRNQQAQQPQQKQEEPWWKAPEFDERWWDQVYQDDQGRILAKPGYPPDLPAKIEAYQQFQRQKIAEFMRDPVNLIKPGLERVLKPMIEEAINGKVGQFGQELEARDFVAQNASWIYQQGPGGQQVMSPAGQRFTQYVQFLANAGMNPQQQQELALRLLRGDILAQQMQSQQQPQQQAQQPQLPPPQLPPQQQVPHQAFYNPPQYPQQQPAFPFPPQQVRYDPSPAAGGNGVLPQMQPPQWPQGNYGPQAGVDQTPAAGNDLRSMLRESFRQNGIGAGDRLS
jgi:hypothetical protein